MPHTNNPLDGFTELTKAARIIELHPTTLHRRAQRGELQLYRAGKTLYVKLEDLVPKPVPRAERRAS